METPNEKRRPVLVVSRNCVAVQKSMVPLYPPMRTVNVRFRNPFEIETPRWPPWIPTTDRRVGGAS